MMTVPPEGHEGGTVVVGEYEFAPFWSGETAFLNRRRVVVRGITPGGEEKEAEVSLPNAGALVVIKAQSMVQPRRSTPARDAYDIYMLLSSYPGGPENFTEELVGLREREELSVAVDILEALFVESREGVLMVVDVFRERGEALPRVAADVRATVRAFVEATKRWIEDKG